MILLKIISTLHALFVAFMILAPFSGSTYFVFMHSIIAPFVMLHWILNNNSCSVTAIENYLRKQADPSAEYNCITCKLIEPVFDFRKNYAEYTAVLYGATTLLWLVSLTSLALMYRKGDIKSFYDLYKI